MTWTIRSTTRRAVSPGRAFGVYLIWYGLGRSWFEAIRVDPTSDAPLGIPANSWASFIAIALGITLVVVQTLRHREAETSVYRPGHHPEAPKWSMRPPTRRPRPRPRRSIATALASAAPASSKQSS